MEPGNYVALREGYVESISEERFIENESDLLDFIGFCGENDRDRAILYAANVPEDFYRLGTGVAGAFLGKLQTYRVRVVWILDSVKVRGKFADMVLEANRWNDFHYTDSLEEAKTWLENPKNFSEVIRTAPR
ncbi:MAG TPA: DUF4180 domain-containing protein [Thermotogota bacterium]|nr:DUF4180 domain-containing protein [Thermotogota bacterium]HPM21137.1 DUF4180 domain-containing protein [Thermotogota bacterium]